MGGGSTQEGSLPTEGERCQEPGHGAATSGCDAERRRRPSHRSEVGAAASGDHVCHSSDCDRNRKVPDLGFPSALRGVGAHFLPRFLIERERLANAIWLGRV